MISSERYQGDLLCWDQLVNVAGGPAHSSVSSAFSSQQFHLEFFYAMLFSSGKVIL